MSDASDASDALDDAGETGETGVERESVGLSVSQYIDRIIEILEKAEALRLDAERKAQNAVAIGALPQLHDDPSSILGSPAELHALKLQFDQRAGPLVQVAYGLSIDAAPLDDFIRTGKPDLVPGAIRVLRLIQAEDLRRRVPALCGESGEPKADLLARLQRAIDAVEALAEHEERKAAQLPAPKSAGEHQAEWLGKAMLMVRNHPDWSDAEIARRVGKSPGTLSRSDEYQRAAKLARGSKADRPKGYVTVDPDSGAADVEAVAPPAEGGGPSPADDRSDRGKPIAGSRYFREYCAKCGEPMRVTPDKVGTKPVCSDCAE